MDRNIYLTNTDIQDVVVQYLKKLQSAMDSVGEEVVDIRSANGRVVTKPVFARISSPNHNAAAMDGIMVTAEKTYGASETSPLVLARGKDFEYINTGHPIREPYDSVIMIEDVVMLEETLGLEGEDEAEALNSEKKILGIETSQVKIKESASPWQHIRPIGEDMVAGEMIIPGNHKIRPMDMGAILAGGVMEVEVYKQIHVGIMPTGTEITDCYTDLKKGKIFDTNSWTFKAIAEEMGCIAERVSPVNDNYEDLKAALEELIKRNHIVVINAGSSAGSKDFTASLIREMGEVTVHGIAIKPGKPTILGLVKNRAVIGVPGYPGSAFLVFEEIVGPIIRALQRKPEISHRYEEAGLSRRLVSSLKYREYIRVKLGMVEGRLIATPLARRAGANMPLVRADGILIIPKNSEGIEAGEKAPVELLKDMKTIENTIVSIGSHDLIMDFIGDLLEKNGSNFHLSSAHVGSMGGIMALRKGEAHIAPIHLLDEDTGKYNQAYIEKYLGQGYTLIKGVKRIQGFMVPRGNPKAIKSVKDLVAPGILFVNRQLGSGTRILTDYLLSKEGVCADEINGYGREMTTHMAVAAAVESGSADAGVGVASAAKAMKLDFVEIGCEEYDFAIAEKYMETPMIKAFCQVLKSEEFEKILKELGGYEL